jgi:hypothetical protein
MTDRAQFEAMLEALINDDQAQAKEIFHNIVVGKSREIYEELLAEDFSQDSGNPYKKESAEEEMQEEDDMPAMEASDEDEADDAEDDVDAEEDDVDADAEDDGEENPFGDEEGDDTGDEDLEDRVMDLEDALEDLKAEFEQLLADEGEEDSMDMGADDMGGDMGAGDMGGDMGVDAEVDELASLMEYVDKVAPAKMGDNGANTRSAVAGKNDMGGTTANMTKSFSTEKGGTQGGLAAPTTKPQDGGNVNVPGAKKATSLKPVKGGGIDRQAGFDNPAGRSAGAGTGAVSHDGEKNTQSTLRGRK